MNTKQQFITFIMLLVAISNYAQVNTQFTQAGIAVQGIVRDANNTAIQSQTVALNFEFYYDSPNGSEESVTTPFTKNVTTDAFGVFSTIIDPNAINNFTFSNYQIKLRIKRGSAILSDTNLQHVPYAISANNGVPTGSVMPFLGTAADVPLGWILCDGSSLPANAIKLKAMIGNNAPNLQGMFLRGAGTNSMTNQTTTLNATQDDTYSNHSHAATADRGGDHEHQFGDNYVRANVGSGAFVDNGSAFGLHNEPNVTNSTDKGRHDHNIQVSQSTTGGTETRPVNYGVNYIIKL